MDPFGFCFRRLPSGDKLIYLFMYLCIYAVIYLFTPTGEFCRSHLVGHIVLGALSVRILLVYIFHPLRLVPVICRIMRNDDDDVAEAFFVNFAQISLYSAGTFIFFKPKRFSDVAET